MSKVSMNTLLSRGRNMWVMTLAAALTVMMAAPVEAVDLSGKSGKYTLRLDTTLSWGALYRVEDRDPAIISPFEGGTAWSVNGDDGNLNFDTGLVSNTVKATIDLDFQTRTGHHNLGFFVRGTGFYDFELEGDCCARTELTQEALDWAGSRAELLDAYAFWQFPLGKGTGQIRAGYQVLNWGESTFIPGGIGIINPVDVSALRVPGAELREAYRPVGIVSASVDLSAQFALEGFYQFEWEETVIDPPGTYFSTNDFAGRGGSHVFLAFASFPDTGESPFYVQPPVDYPFMSVPRAPDREPEDGGQYGLSLHWFVPSLGGTEFGLYYINYHSRLPTINGITGHRRGSPGRPGGRRRGGTPGLRLLRGAARRQPRGRRRRPGSGVSSGHLAYASTANYLRRLPRRHQALRPQLERPARHLGHRLPGRGLLPPGCTVSGRRRRATLRRPVARQRRVGGREPGGPGWGRILGGDPRLPAP